MNADQETYKRGANAALVGLAIQFILGLGMAAIGLWSDSAPFQTTTWHLFGGCLIWLILFLVYNQHRIERVEALEAEQVVKQDQVAAAMFEEHADDLDLARRRLDRLYKWGLGVVSFLLAGYLIIVGVFRFLAARAQTVEAETLAESALASNIVNPAVEMTWLLVLVAPIAFVSFIGARYVAGMTSIKEWTLLRGGASYLMSSFFLSALLFIGVLIETTLESRTFLALTALIIPALMVLIGVEILMTFVLSAYRPRQADEVARPPFDSRVLGLLTSSNSLASIINEAINYQFGFEISRSWFYQLLSKSVTPLTIAGMVLLFLFSSIVIVGPHEQAVITNFGSIARVVDSGLHMKRPWPFASATKYDVGKVHSISVGSSRSKDDPNVAILWTNQHSEGEHQYLVTVPPAFEAHGNGDTPSGAPGTSLLAAEVQVQFRIKNLQQYLQSASDPKEVLTILADAIVNEYFATHPQDELLAAGRVEAGQALKKRIVAAVDGFNDGKGLGLNVTFVGFSGIHPPQSEEDSVAAAFHTQIGAIQERETLIHAARREADSMLAEVAGSFSTAQAINDAIVKLEEMKGEGADSKQILAKEAEIDRMLAEASGMAASSIHAARAYRWQRAVTERAKAEKFAAESLAYDKAPSYYRQRHYLDAMAIGMQGSRKVITTTKSEKEPIIRLDLKDDANALSSLLD